MTAFIMKIVNILPFVLFAVFFFGFCVFIHELGHFLAAKWRGMHINAFSLGFKKAWGKTYNGVDYRIGWLPFGGYVDLPQIDSSGDALDQDGKPLKPVKPIDKIIVAAAGPFFNVLFGLFLGIFVWTYGLPQSTPDYSSFIVANLDNSSPEYAAGLRDGDTVIKLNGKKFNKNWDKIRRQMLFHLGPIKLTVVAASDNKEKEISYKPKANPITKRDELAIPFFRPSYTGVLDVSEGSPQYKAGLRTGDIVVKVNGKVVAENLSLARDIADYLQEKKKKKTVNITVQRANKLVNLQDMPLKEAKLKEAMFAVGYAYSQDKAMTIGKLVSQNAKNAGFKVGDVVVGFNNKRIVNPNTLFKQIQDNGVKSCTINILRKSEGSIDIKVTPLKLNLQPFAGYKKIYSYPNPFKQFSDTISMTYSTLQSVFAGKKRSSLKAKNFSGPIGIFNAIYIVASDSWMRAIHLIVVISFSLAILNIMPLPVLDGGHIVVSSIQWMRKGKPVPEWILKPIYIVFILFIIGFFLYVTMNDILRVKDRYLPKSYEEKFKNEEKVDSGKEKIIKENKDKKMNLIIKPAKTGMEK